MFTDIAQEGQHVHAAKPVIVVRRDRRVVAAVKIKERGYLFADFIHPLLHGILGIQLTLSGFKAWVANQTGSAAHQRHRFMTCLLEAFQA